MNKCWQRVFFNNIDKYIGLINNFLSNEYKPEPLSNFVKILGGYAFKSSLYRKDGIPIIRISDFSQERIVLDNVKYYDEDSSLDKYCLNQGDIIIALTGGTIGKLAIVQNGVGKIYLNQRVGKFKVLDENKFDPGYIYWIARGVEAKIKSIAWGGAQPNVSPRQIESMEFPIPDKKTQIEIISFLQDLHGNCLDKRIYFNLNYENTITKLQINSIKISNVSQETFHQELLLKQLRQSILQEAVEGKLTAEWRKQNPDLISGENHAARLLEKIKAEKEQLIDEGKIKKQKPLPPISDDEKPFDLPEGWVWCRLGEIAQSLRYGTSKRCEYNDSLNTPVLRIPNVSSGHINLSDLKYTNLNEKEKSDLCLKKGDILLIRSNGSSDIVGRPALVSKELESYSYAGYLVRLRYNCAIINSMNLINILNSDYLRKKIEIPLRTTVGIKNINSTEISNLPIPISPYKEQEVIVNKVHQLMAKIYTLEKQVKSRKAQAEQLMQAVLREAFNGE